MLDTLNRKARYQLRIIRNRYYWRIIADGTHPIVAAFLAVVDCGDLVMHSLLYGRLGQQ